MIRFRLISAVASGAAMLVACGGSGEPSASSAQSLAMPQAPLMSQTNALAPQSASLDSLRRVTTSGPVLGAAEGGAYSWLGLPYAKPPVGALRWKPAIDPEPWTETRHARNFGASCAQGGRYFSPAPDNGPFGLSVRDGLGKPVGSEDCLTLNIWRPSNDKGDLPVMVFIHGGSNISGYSADPIYHGAALANRANAVVVTLNYRLGLFGWLDLAQIKTGDPVADSGNFGLLDQIQALKYIRANVAQFGGNPGNVTLMGESAGAVNIWALMTSPLAAGLFHKAVPMSGGVQTATAVEARAYARALLQSVVIADGKAANPVAAELFLALKSSSQIASYLRSVPPETLIRAEASSLLNKAPAVFGDGHVIPLDPHAAILAGAYNRMPVLASNTLEEGKLFGGLVGAYKPSDYDRFTMQYLFDPDAAPTFTEADLINPQYLPVDQPVTGWNTVSAAMGHAVFTRGTIASMGVLATQQPSQIWYYRFDWAQQPVPFNTVYGAAHAMDLPFAFGNFGKSVFSFGYSTANKPGREALSDAMMRTLGAFAATGNPHHDGLGTGWANWPATMVFDASKTQTQIRAQ